ncbi:hypothetical protein DFP72DRAFT_878212 [Ephemerocybe angulata]|uniref:N-acetyltransferase domain-containing protein n=1 Tax=Ephemerocybe angulata TaxID=980116 RepID=A0A8H6IDE2_9AGAR|nr:hypothetical protein DFP72DRAFT_878212 [Tulosesus angulatus]
MLHIPLIATSPECQGHGYGSALLAKVTNLADSKGLSSWLVSSNILNEPFYNSHGFKAVGDIHLGEGNLNWNKDPIFFQVMIREPILLKA